MMSGNNIQPLRPVMQRLQDGGSGIDEVISMIQLLDTYASTAFGASHLIRENILNVLLKNMYVIDATDKDFYSERTEESSETSRSLHSLLFCHIFVLIRSFNEHFLQEDGGYAGPSNDENLVVDAERYLKQLLHFL